MPAQKPLFQIVVAGDNSADATRVREALNEVHYCALHAVKGGREVMAFIENLNKDPKEPRLDLLLLDTLTPSEKDRRGAA
jgi:CheY-like chemotaxis protein